MKAKRILQKVNAVVTTAALAILLIAAVAGSVTGKPVLLTAVRSGSMSPTLNRGDLVVLRPVGEHTPVEIGDIIVFKVSAGSLRNAGWVIHRTIAGDPESGFITQGDNNDGSDQQGDANPPVTRADIAAKAITIGTTPVHIPLLGFLPVWTETVVSQPYALPGAAVLLLALSFASHAAGRTKQRRSRRSPARTEPFVYLIGGLSLMVLVAASGLLLSQSFTITYSVSAEGRAAVMGSTLGQLQVGDQVERTLTTLENKRGRLPLILAAHNSDPQIQLSHQRGRLVPGDELEIKMNVTGTTVGEYRSTIWLGLFYPILPAAVIQSLAGYNFWLALVVVSFIPALPVFLIPVLDQDLRTQLVQFLRRSSRRLHLWR